MEETFRLTIIWRDNQVTELAPSSAEIKDFFLSLAFPDGSHSLINLREIRSLIDPSGFLRTLREDGDV